MMTATAKDRKILWERYAEALTDDSIQGKLLADQIGQRIGRDPKLVDKDSRNLKRLLNRQALLDKADVEKTQREREDAALKLQKVQRRKADLLQKIQAEEEDAQRAVNQADAQLREIEAARSEVDRLRQSKLVRMAADLTTQTASNKGVRK